MLTITRIFAAIGIIALGYAGLRMAVPTYDRLARLQFGNDEALTALVDLYNRVAAEDIQDTALREVHFPNSSFSRSRRVPKEWFPDIFPMWGVPQELGSDYAYVGDVVAHYDEDDTLIGVEFCGTRFGCFISSDPVVPLHSFGALHRIITEPLYVTTWIIPES